jgi:hypothetical protein
MPITNQLSSHNNHHIIAQLSDPNNISPQIVPHISLRNKTADVFQVSLNAAFRHTKFLEK